MFSLLLAATAVSAQDFVRSLQTNDLDYTCNPIGDTCSSNGVCEDPEFGGSNTNPACRNADCLDCNVNCRQFENDCYGCLNAQGCYYCPEDGTCDNSDLYLYSIAQKQCRSYSTDYLSTRNGNTPDQCIESDSYFFDPQYQGSKWMYEMINVVDVWDEFDLKGRNVTVRINDDGVYVDHDEFIGRFAGAENSCELHLPNGGEDHGSIVAGIIAANADNNLCSAGVAPEAQFSSCNVFAPGRPRIGVMLVDKLDTFDISTNSWGIPSCIEGDPISGDETIIYDPGCPFTYSDQSEYRPCDVCDGQFVIADRILTSACENAIFNHCKKYYRDDIEACADFPEIIVGGECDYDKIPNDMVEAFVDGVTNGRDGKGTIFLFSSGNYFDTLDDVNFGGITNSRLTITVGAVGKNGLHTTYSSPGAAVACVAPVGDDFDVQDLQTIGVGSPTQCGNSGQGTSFSMPVVTAVVALLLEANPDLSWRDVQGILAQTSTIVDDPKDDTTVTNAAGIWHSNWYGWGIVNTYEAVIAAMNWDFFTEELQAIGFSADENAVLDDTPGNEFVSSLTLNPIADNYPDGFIAESTVVMLDLTHYQRGDLEIELVSPSGTSSVLSPGNRRENNQLEPEQRWKLMSLRNWGEDPTGVWQLKIRDLVDRDREGPISTNDGETNGEATNDEGMFLPADVIGKHRNLEDFEPNVFRSWKIVVYGRSSSDETPKPSAAPTGSPTDSPSGAPTESPTDSPSGAPTESPTDSPSGAPTESPTDSPNSAPMESPTDSPSSAPTESPTDSPSGAPTESPTDSPSGAPTESPIDSSTESPTGNPSDVPTGNPSGIPTGSPTVPTPTDKPIEGCSDVYTVPATLDFAEFVNDCLNIDCPWPNPECWDVSQVTDMSNAFSSQKFFNAPIGIWDTSSVTTMKNMFKGTKKFNQDISDWDVSSVEDMGGMFDAAAKFDKDIQAWDVSNMKHMANMFKNAKVFNQGIEDWDVSSVTSMKAMFMNAKKFDQPLDAWDTSSVKNMNDMFKKAKKFNQCLSTWSEEYEGNRQKKTMFTGTLCPGPATPPDDGPWCQTEAEGCTSGDPCSDSTGSFTITQQTSCDEIAALDVAGQMEACLGSPEFSLNCPTICNGSCEAEPEEDPITMQPVGMPVLQPVGQPIDVGPPAGQPVNPDRPVFIPSTP